jgi:hypothetical protein
MRTDRGGIVSFRILMLACTKHCRQKKARI